MLNWVGMGADVVRVGDAVQTPRDTGIATTRCLPQIINSGGP